MKMRIVRSLHQRCVLVVRARPCAFFPAIAAPLRELDQSAWVSARASPNGGGKRCGQPIQLRVEPRTLGGRRLEVTGPTQRLDLRCGFSRRGRGEVAN